MAGSVFLATPQPILAPPVLAPQWNGMQSTWTSWEGVTVDLMTLASGVMLTNQGLRGLGPPPFTVYKSTSPAVSGSSYRGFTALEREVFWPLFVYASGGSLAWVEHDSQLWRSFRPDKTGIWTVTVPGRTPRSLRLRFNDDGNQSYALDPVKFGWQFYGLTLVAEQPYWEGVPQTATFNAVTPVDFFNGGAAPPFNITEGGSTSTAAIANPGDVDAYPVHTVYGPTTSATVGVGADVTTVPFTLTGGQFVTIDTNPTAQTAIDHTGADRIGDLSALAFPPVPPGASSPLTVSITGAGSVTTELVPLYFRYL